MGNIGAYIGLFLGYSALQILDLMQFVSREFKKYHDKRRSTIHDAAQHTSEIHVKTVIRHNINQCLTKGNPNSDVLCIILTELELISEKVDALEKIISKTYRGT